MCLCCCVFVSVTSCQTGVCGCVGVVIYNWLCVALIITLVVYVHNIIFTYIRM